MKKHLLAAAIVALAAGSAMAQANDTLAKIKGSGSVTLGVRESSGLSYTLGNGKYVGFHTEMGERVLADMQKQLGLAKLDVKYQPVTSQNRIPLVTNGTVDLECGSTTNNAARQKDVAFAVTTYVEEVRIAVKANSGINSITQLNGKTVATTTGTTSCRPCASTSAPATA
jgi:glutamate/aspartate transport system substrate-binding protein